MLLKVTDATGASQTIITPAQESVSNRSGSIAVTAVAQQALAANSFRSGWVMQNNGANPMFVNELGTASVGSASFAVAPGTVFPPAGFPIGTGAVSVLGTAGDQFACREW